MKNEPLLASRALPNGPNDRVRMVFKVYGGLSYIKGNNKPYFSLTYWKHRKGFPNQCESGGAGHEEILKYYPQFSDLAALHLSDIDGVPIHAEANGWYNLAGALGGAGERYTVLTSDRHFPITPPADKPWKNTEYRKPTEAEALAIFADYVRVPLVEAEKIKADVASKWNYPDMKARWSEICETMKLRWKSEAEACIAKHKLAVYGDQWPAEAA